MKLRTLAALVALAHALVHPAVHGLPGAAVFSEPQAQAPASPAGTDLLVSSALPCPACVAQRFVAPLPLVVFADPPEWQPLAAAPPRLPSTFLLFTRPARAPPQTS